MVHLQQVIQRNRDPEMHAALRVPGARGEALRKHIEQSRRGNRKRKAAPMKAACHKQ